MSENITIECVDPKTLSDSWFLEIHELMREIWSDKESLWELLQCMLCSRMYSRTDICDLMWLSDTLSVSSMIRDHKIQKHLCMCGGGLKLVYDDDHISRVRERMLETKKAFLVLVKNASGKIVGYEDAYIDSFNPIFEREFSYHYSSIGAEKIRTKVEALLWPRWDDYIVLSNIWLQREYRSFEVIFRVLHEMSKLFETTYDRLPCITEIDRRNPLHKVSMSVGGLSLRLLEDPEFSGDISNKNSDYQSDIIVYPSITRIYREYFGGNIRDYVRKTRSK